MTQNDWIPKLEKVIGEYSSYSPQKKKNSSSPPKKKTISPNNDNVKSKSKPVKTTEPTQNPKPKTEPTNQRTNPRLDNLLTDSVYRFQIQALVPGGVRLSGWTSAVAAGLPEQMAPVQHVLNASFATSIFVESWDVTSKFGFFEGEKRRKGQ